MDVFDWVELKTSQFRKQDTRGIWQRTKDWWHGISYCPFCAELTKWRTPSYEEKLSRDAPMAFGMSYSVCSECDCWFVYGVDGLISVRTSSGQ